MEFTEETGNHSLAKKCMYVFQQPSFTLDFLFVSLLTKKLCIISKNPSKNVKYPSSNSIAIYSMLSQIRSQKFQFWHEILPPLWSKNLPFTPAWTTRNLGIWETASSGSQGETEYHQPPSIYPPPAYLNFIMPPPLPTPFHSHLPINPWWKRQFYMFTLNYLPFLRAL